MANLHSVEAAILALVNTAVTGLTCNNLPIQVMAAIGWPPEKVLQENVRGTTSVISIYDRKMAKNTTRWNPIILQTSVVTSTLTSELSSSSIPAGQSITLTLGATVTPGDAVSAVIKNSNIDFTTNEDFTTSWSNVAAQVAIGGASDNPTSMATQLASLINADPVLSTWVSATSTGPVVTITNTQASGTIVIESYTGNGGSNLREIGRRDRNFQCVIWSPTSDIRTVVTTAVETMLQQQETNFGITFADGSGGRVFNQNDYDLEDSTLADTYRHDFLFSIDYPITEQDNLYSVLAPIPQYTVE